MDKPYCPQAEAFRYQAGSTGCLLIHGLTGCPFELQELGEKLYQAGYTVSGPRLAGHATDDWHDLARSTWQDWVQSAASEYQYLAAHCDQVILAGLSLGGDVTLWLAANQLASPAALIIMATPMLVITPWQRRLLPWLSRLLPYTRKAGSGIYDPAAYASHITGRHMVYQAVLSADDFLTQLRPLLPQIQAPALLIYSEKDRTVKPSEAQDLYAHLGSTQKKLVWLKNSSHILTRDYDKQIVFNEVLACAQRVRDGLPPVA
jgi:carboxylesterase